MWVRSLVPSFSVACLSAFIAFVAGLMLIPTAADAQVSVLTFHNDNGRTGQNLSETTLTPTSVSPGAFGKLFSYPVDGYVYAQPLYLPSVSIPGQGVHNVVFVATEHDSVYAFDADGLSLTPLWKVSFINPSLGITTVPANDVNNTPQTPGNDIIPEIGITGTPVIDPQSGTLYVVAKTKEIVGGQAHYLQRLHALDITTGAEKFGGPVVIGDAILTAPFTQGGTSIYVSGPSVTNSSGNKVSFDAVWALDRGGLMLLNGVLYIAWASHGDSGPYHGWVTAYNPQTLALVALFNNTPNGQLGGMWMGGGGPAADSSGNIYVSAGNGTFDVTGSSSPAYGDSVVRLDPTKGLSVADYFTPFDQATLDNNDLDLAAGGVVALPDQTGTATPHMLVAGGKTGKIYLINRDNGMMGKYQQCGATCDAVLSVTSLPRPIFDVPAYFNGWVYYQGVGDVLKAFQLANGQLSSSPVSQSTTSFGFPGATPSISANGTSNGIVWTIQVDGYVNGTPAVLHAYNALNLSQELYNSNMVSSDQLASGVKFNTPTIVNGKVYVGTQTQLSVFGPVPLGTPANLTATAVSSSQINLTWTAATRAVGYQIERCQGVGCSNFVQIGTSTSTTFANTGLTPSTSYSYRVRATDSAGNLSPYSNIASATTPAPDTTPPTAPSGLTASALSSSQISLAWTASTDNVGVTGYLVERCQGAGCSSFAQIGTSTSTSYADAGLTPSTSYSYRVRATDAAGNLSSYSNTASATTSASTGGTIKFVQGNFQAPQSPSTSVVVTYAAAQSAGDLNVVVVGWNNATTTVSSVTDTKGNTYALAVGPTVQPAGGGLSQAIYYAKNIASATANGNSVTVGFSGAAAFPDVRVLEYSGLSPTSPLDVTASAIGNSATTSSGTATTTSANELLVAANTVWTTTVGPGAGFTSRMITTPDGDIAEDGIVTATGSYQATASLSGAGPWVMQMAGFRAGP